MTEFNMDHLNFLEQVMKEDLAEIRRKEATYKGSWKRRGGVGAFFVSFRKVDRLEQIVESHGYDIFRALAADPSGADGSTLAEVRDLRRYLTLIESEMLSRMNKTNIHSVDTFVRAMGGPGTPEDGGHHARYKPRLEDGLLKEALDMDEASYYIPVPRTNGGAALYIVDRRGTPQEYWDHLPRLDFELNHTEHEQLAQEYRPLYKWVEEKWRLEPQYRDHWGKV